MKPNIIPSYTELEFYLRAPSRKELSVLTAKVENCFKSAAVATGCKVRINSLSCVSVTQTRTGNQYLLYLSAQCLAKVNLNYCYTFYCSVALCPERKLWFINRMPQNLRGICIGRDLWRSSGLILPSEQDQLEQVAE